MGVNECGGNAKLRTRLKRLRKSQTLHPRKNDPAAYATRSSNFAFTAVPSGKSSETLTEGR
jgi:hypothetical protein